ncbi:hypothetical protein PV783_34380, partial [Chitinophaga sp. CC14]|uniref:hypothetical protein n=1 Tax=Chitinophaga sp. CC14 TaxID=3029199 RepID=UPI003B7624EF
TTQCPQQWQEGEQGREGKGRGAGGRRGGMQAGRAFGQAGRRAGRQAGIKDYLGRAGRAGRAGHHCPRRASGPQYPHNSLQLQMNDQVPNVQDDQLQVIHGIFPDGYGEISPTDQGKNPVLCLEICTWPKP